MKALVAERRCAAYFQRVIALTNLFDKMATRFSDPSIVISSRELLSFNPKYDKIELLGYLDDPQFRVDFARLYPTFAHLIEAGEALVADMDELETIKKSLVRPHVAKCKTKLCRERLDVDTFTLAERASMNGLNPMQQAAYEANLDDNGFMALSMDERLRFSNAIWDKVTEE